MRLLSKAKIARRVVVFALSLLPSVIGASFPAEHGTARGLVSQAMPLNHVVDRAKKGDRLKAAPSYDALRENGGGRIESRPRVTKLATMDMMPRTPTHMNKIFLSLT
jgi:hypothetical protein